MVEPELTDTLPHELALQQVPGPRTRIGKAISEMSNFAESMGNLSGTTMPSTTASTSV